MNNEVFDTIKCVRCQNAFQAGEIAGPERLTRMEMIEMIIQQLGWRKTFAGWQCQDHLP